jgi:pSer/pThr/pTyr-binding forkhead associated (FHA) protein
LATLEVLNEGPQKGTVYSVVSPLTNIGRGAHNDVVLHNESVSDSHAKLQKRESGWFIVDIDSTNGTYVGGRRIAGEQRLEGAPDLRFGDVKVAFRAAAEPLDTGKGTRAIPGVAIDEAKRVVAQRKSVAAPSPAAAPVPSAPANSGSSGMMWVVIGLVVIGAAVGVYFFFKG